MANTNERRTLVEDLCYWVDQLPRLYGEKFLEAQEKVRWICDALRAEPDATPPPPTTHITSTLHTEVHELRAMVSGLQVLAGNSGEDVGLSGFELMMLLDPVHDRLTGLQDLLEGDPLRVSQREFMRAAAGAA